MNLFSRPACIAALVLSATSLAAMAQSSPSPSTLPETITPSASGPAPAASSALGPRLRSAAETGNRATAPGDLRPERPVTPQISIPFGKKPAAPAKGEERATQRSNPATTGGIDDAAARCDAQGDDSERAACRAKLSREAKGKLPN